MQDKISDQNLQENSSINVVMKIPHELVIEMVQANNLRHYEKFSIATSFFFSAFASLLAAAIVDKFEEKILLVVSAIFFVAFIIFLIFSLIERKEVYKTKKTLDLGRMEWRSQG